MKTINDLKLEYTTESKFIFSELGSIVLGKTIEKGTKMTLHDAMFQIMTIIGMSRKKRNCIASRSLGSPPVYH